MSCFYVVPCRWPSFLWGNLCWQRDPEDSDGGNWLTVSHALKSHMHISVAKTADCVVPFKMLEKKRSQSPKESVNLDIKFIPKWNMIYSGTGQTLLSLCAHFILLAPLFDKTKGHRAEWTKWRQLWWRELCPMSPTNRIQQQSHMTWKLFKMRLHFYKNMTK